MKLLRFPPTTRATGATLGQEHLRGFLPQLSASDPKGPERVILDFADIEEINGSYFRATYGWLYDCSQRAALGLDAEPSSDPWRARPLDLIPMVMNLSPAVRTEIGLYLEKREAPCIEAIEWTEDSISAEVLNRLEPSLERTLGYLMAHAPTTAGELLENYPDERVILTAWNNRLAELYRLRLVFREKQGRSWFYRPVFEKLMTNVVE